MVGLLGLAASVVPSIIGLFDKKAGSVAEDVVKAGMELTGAATEEEAVGALNANPELLAKYKEKVLDIELAFYREDTKRMDIVNTTMRAEIAGSGIFKTGWRPAFGWVAAVSFGFTVFGFLFLMGWAVIENPENLSDLILAMEKIAAVMVSLWTVALTVLGVAVWKRSDDKKVATGEPTGMAGIAKGIRGLLGK